jgi:hypothetical protein
MANQRAHAGQMKIPMAIVCVLLSALLSVQGWTLLQIVGMEKDIAAIKATLRTVAPTVARE